MAKGKGKKTPSRIKYEQNNRVVSFRASKDLYDWLEAVKKAEGKSNTDVLKVGLGLIEVKRRNEKEIRDKAYEEGWQKGIESALELCEVRYPCNVCGKEMSVDTEEEKEAIRGYIQEHGWGHRGCQDQQR